MPQENRKRGKKHKAQKIEQTRYEDTNIFGPPDAVEVHPSRVTNADAAPGTPFGLLNPDVKAYFRTVDNQLREWQEEGLGTEIETDLDPNEERRMFFTAALSEMNGKELQLATDPDCSPILERMLHSMDDFTRRVFTDTLAGSWLSLITDRFASHVCQTLLTIAAETVGRETRGMFPTAPISEGKGELLTMTQLILYACEEILPELLSFIQNQFASHVLRALLSLLAPMQFALPEARSHKHVPSDRSKKSASWKTRHGPMKPVISDEYRTLQSDGAGGLAKPISLLTPDEFLVMAKRFLDKIRNGMGDNELRALAVDKVASPVLQMFLELEASMGQADAPDCIMDCVLAGLITEYDSGIKSSPSSYVSALLVDATSSHLSESILSHCSSTVFDRIWECYFTSDLPKLAIHPVANFVVARGVERLDEGKLNSAITQLHAMWGKMLKSSRMGVLVAMIERAGQLGVHEADLVKFICNIFGLTSLEMHTFLVPCVLRLKTLAEYQDVLARGEMAEDSEGHNAPHETQNITHNARRRRAREALEPKTQGSILIQCLLRLHEPHNQIVLENLFSLPPTELLALAYNSTSSRILDVALDSPTVPSHLRKRLVRSFIGQFHLLVDDRIGSRVADRCWEAADPYLKEKIARSLIPHDQFLAGSHFGRFFARRLGLPLLQRKPEQWKAMQSNQKKVSPATSKISRVLSDPSTRSPAVSMETSPVLNPQEFKGGSKRKRRNTGHEDEIDALFSGIRANKRAAGIGGPKHADTDNVGKTSDLDAAVLKAIRSAPGDTQSHRTKK